MSGIHMGAIASMAASPPLAFDIDQATRSGSCNSFGGTCQATSNSATTTTSGGKTPYSYQWTFVSGDSFFIETPTASSTTFSKTNSVIGNPSFEGTYKCVVTDDNSDSLEDTVVVSLNFLDLT